MKNSLELTLSKIRLFYKKNICIQFNYAYEASDSIIDGARGLAQGENPTLLIFILFLYLNFFFKQYNSKFSNESAYFSDHVTEFP